MADHVIQQFLVAVQARLTGLATSGARVYLDRPVDHPLQAGELPALRIYDESSEAEDAGYSATQVEVFREEVSLIVECVTKAAAGASSLSRQMQKEVQIALAQPFALAGAPVPLLYRGYDHSSDASTDREVVVRRLRFSAILFTSADAPDASA